MKIKLQTFYYICDKCGKTYDAPELAGGNYGMFLLRSIPSGHMAIYNALEDPVYNEVEELIRELIIYAKINDLMLADILQKIIYITFDKTKQGEIFGMNIKPRCIHCNDANIKSWQASDPPILKEYSLDEPTHFQWNRLSKYEKVALIERSLIKEEICKP